MSFLNNYIKNINLIVSTKSRIIKFCYYYIEIQSLTKRLVIQTCRRPSTFIISMIQPLLWLSLFGALFQNAPITFFTETYKYSSFLHPGIIVFTVFTTSLNAGLPLVFDREFGFLNRLLCSPISMRYSIIISSCFSTLLLSTFQVSTVLYVCNLINNYIIPINNLLIITIILLLFSNCVTSISLIFAVILPSHVELLAFIIIINLPLLFSSTALAPLIFMPSWLQIVASINPLSYVIETIRYKANLQIFHNNSIIITTILGKINLQKVLIILCILNFLCFIIIKNLVSQKFNE